MSSTVLTLASRALIRISGADWRRFLQGLITQDAERLGDGECAYGALLTPQGRLLHDFFLWTSEEACLVDVAASGAEDLARRLALYRLRAKVEIQPAPGAVAAALGGAQAPPLPPRAQGPWRADPRLPELGWRAILDGDHAAEPDAAWVYRRFCLERGVGALELDARESDYPLELNLDLFGGVDFKKGCFVGQETTSRMHRRGVVKSRLLPVAFSGSPPAFAAEILAGSLRAGEMRGGLEGRGLALLRLDRVSGRLHAPGPVDAASPAEETSEPGEREVRVDPQPWMARLPTPLAP